MRTSIYFLKESLNTEQFSQTNSFELVGEDLLKEDEKPNINLLLAKGERWDRKWTYLLDAKSNRLWVELAF